MYDIDPNLLLNLLKDVMVYLVDNCIFSKMTLYLVHFDILTEKKEILIKSFSNSYQYLFNNFRFPSGIFDKNPSAIDALPIVVSLDEENRLHK